MLQGSGGKVGTKPDPIDKPVKPGDFIEVSHSGRGPVWWKADGDKDWNKVDKDPKTGKKGIRVPRRARGITISDRKVPDASTVYIVVIEEDS